MGKPLVLVTGHKGQLGSELKVLSKKYHEFDFVFTGILELDITNPLHVNNFFDQYSPAICINAAAYTAVDKAETDRQTALKINAEAVGYLAENCARHNCRLFHVSTDYVFDGTATTPYDEDDPVCPVNFYGESKLKGEEIAMEKCSSVCIIRTSWVYSYYGNNFVKTMLRLMKERETLNVIDDQFGSPTYAADLADVIMRFASSKKINSGVYHYSNDGIISWFDFAIAIRDIAGLACNVVPIDTFGYPTPAKRPAYSAMNKEKIKSTGIEIKDWKVSLKECLHLLKPE